MIALLEKQDSGFAGRHGLDGTSDRGGVLEGRSPSLFFLSVGGFIYTVGVLIFCLALLALGLYHLIRLSLCLGLFEKKKGR